MNFPEDTITAVSTPPGEGGIGIVRVSGKDSFQIVRKIFKSSGSGCSAGSRSRSIIHGFITDPLTSERVDEVLVTFMRSPRTYTREDVVEINCHGGMMPLRRILCLVQSQGARLADPGEFTRRAFLNGRIDLSQAEAVIDVIRARTEQSERVALQQLEGRLSAEIAGLRNSVTELCVLVEAHIDFPEDEVGIPAKKDIISSINTAGERLQVLCRSFDEGRLYREGAAMAIVGKPNVGKSSLMNALLEKDRAIVTDLPGTTRDIIEEGLNILGLPVRIMDTAGIREAHDLAEAEGVKRSIGAIAGADIVLSVFDAGRPLDDADRQVMDKVRNKRAVFVINKFDIISPEFDSKDPELNTHPCVEISAIKGEGLDALKGTIVDVLITGRGSAGHESAADLLITNIRHKQLVDDALASLVQAGAALEKDEPLEVIALLLRESLNRLGEIIGAVTTDDILDRIFAGFCIGK
jgi:tRNA modification GTPase